ncbi:MAG: hypothetical protein COA49_05200 [Bacteroidetes bacterium]|nr:MAG: hypothetical protein COA49_05200 [Bacteroidota bacterium]
MPLKRRIMKNYTNTMRNFFVVALTIATVFASCKPQPQGSLGEPFDKIVGMIGTWELSSFIQTDLTNPIKEERDLTDFFYDGIVTPMQITLNEDMTYSVAIEMGRNYFGDQGNWGFDDVEHPSYFILETQLSDGTPSDTLQYELGSVIRPFDNSMSIEYNRLCGTGSSASETVLYSFEFNRVD